jgi:hypothetical protein
MSKLRPAKVPFVLPSPAAETDLRPLCRHSDRCEATVYVIVHDPETYSDRSLVWLRLGQVYLRKFDKPYKRWELQAYLGDATDFEHDSAKVICLPIIGLEWDDLFVHYHQTRLNGWVDHQNAEDFHVPRAGYNPLKEKDTVACDRCENKHPMVEKYIPPNDLELFKAVAGKRVEIVIGPVLPKED